MYISLVKNKISSKLCLIIGGGFLIAATYFTSYTSAIARGYLTTDTGLQTGMVAALSVGSSDISQVERATQDNSQRVVGIVTTLDSSLVTIASSNSKILVEDEGEVKAYVSDLNGEVKKGDLLTLSSLKGILMKSGDKPTPVIAVAGADFSSASPEPFTSSKVPNPQTAKIAKITINLNRQGIYNISKTPESSLGRLGHSVTGRDISVLRVAVALVVVFLVLIAEGGILYGAVSSSIMATGRNPLANKAIRRELISVVVTALVIMLVGVAVIYGLLWI